MHSEVDAMGHAHAEDQQTYYLDQLCTLGICGALGVIMVLMRTYEVLPLILHPKFHDAVVWGGYALLGMVAIRGVALWISAGKTASPAPHDHDHDHDDDHVVHAHSHADHGHDHGWAPWQIGKAFRANNGTTINGFLAKFTYSGSSGVPQVE